MKEGEETMFVISVRLILERKRGNNSHPFIHLTWSNLILHLICQVWCPWMCSTRYCSGKNSEIQAKGWRYIRSPVNESSNPFRDKEILHVWMLFIKESLPLYFSWFECKKNTLQRLWQHNECYQTFREMPYGTFWRREQWRIFATPFNR